MKTLVVVNLLPKGHEREAALLTEALQLFAVRVGEVNQREIPLVTLASDAEHPEEADGTAVLAEHSDAAGAAGYHLLDANGRPLMRCFLDGTNSGELLRDPKGKGDSLTGITQHEIGEAMCDATADRYVAGRWVAPNSLVWSLRAQEIGDPCQGQAQTMTLKDGTAVDQINFAIDGNYFSPTPQKGAKFDDMGIFTEPGQLAEDGYQIAARITAEKDVFADLVTHEGRGPSVKARAAKTHPAARTARRIASLVKALRSAE